MVSHFVQSMLLAAVLVSSVLCMKSQAACDEVGGSHAMPYRKFINGEYKNGTFLLPLTGTTNYGSVLIHKIMDNGQACAITDKLNCSGDDLQYAEVDISANFTYTTGSGTTIEDEDVKRYWDWVYEGYEEVGGALLDFSQNCHGYSFGVGDWPADGANGAWILINQIGGGGTYPACYSSQYIHNVDIAMFGDGTHSIKASGSMCFDPYTSWEIYTETTEKFRESGVYRQTGACGGWMDPRLNIKKARESHQTATIVNWHKW